MVGGLWDDSAGTGDQHCQGRLAFLAKQKEQTLIRRPLGELHPAAGSQLPSTVSLAMDFFLSFPQDILQKNNQKRWRKTHMCWLPFHFLQLPLCMTQSSRFRQSHLPHIYVFPLSASQLGLYLAEQYGHCPLFWVVFALSRVFTFSHIVFKLQCWFQLSLLCKWILKR